MRRYVVNLIVPLIAVAFAFAGIVHAQTEANDNPYDDAECSTTISGVVIGSEGNLAVAPSGDLFVSEPNAGCVIRIDPAGVGHFAIGGGRRSETCPACGVRLTSPRDVAVGPDGTVYVLDEADSRIVAVRPDGTATTLIGGGDEDRYASRRAITVDSEGRLYFAERGMVYRLDPSGRIPVAGGGGADVGTGAPATTVKLEGVSDLAAGPGGVLFIAEKWRNRVLKLNGDGTISLFAGTGVNGDNGDGGPATKANLEPDGIAADEAGNVYIAAQFAHRVRRVDPTGQITTYAGRGAVTFGLESGDGGPATQAAITYPTGLASRDGNLYILDTYSRSAIRKVDQAGIITTVAGGGR